MRLTSTPTLLTSRYGPTRTAEATGCASRAPWVPLPDRSEPASTATSIPSGVPFADSGDFVGLSLYYSEHALLFNLANERFVDETLGDHLTTMALVEQPEARGLLVADARVHRDWIVQPYVAGAESSDKFAAASRRGGRCGVAESLDELALLPEEWGYDGAGDRVRHRGVQRGSSGGTEPTPGRKLDLLPLDEPPYYVIEAIPAITFPFYGIRIDSSAASSTRAATRSPGCSLRVRTRAASSSAPTPAASPTPSSSASARLGPRWPRPGPAEAAGQTPISSAIKARCARAEPKVASSPSARRT